MANPSQLAAPHRVLIIGVGSIGERHLRCFQETGRATVAAVELNEQLGRDVAARYGCDWHPNLEAALAHGPYDASVICAPAHLHIPIAQECVAHGHHLLIEKPLAVTPEGVEALRASALASGRVIRVAYIYRSILLFQALRERVASGVIGKPRHVAVALGQDFPKARPAYREIYYAKHATGGGAIQDALTHILHGIEWIIAPITHLSADAQRQVLEGVEVEDTVNLSARLADGTLASFALNQFQAPNTGVIQIHGTDGSLWADPTTQRIGLYRRGGSEWEWSEPLCDERDAGFVRQAHAFLDALEGKPDELAPLEAALQSLRVSIAALESNQTRREVAL